MFKDGVYSHELKTRKPDPKMYEEALSKASNKPEDCIYIDDKLDLLTPAAILGMKTIHFSTLDQKESTSKELASTLLAQALQDF
jgi:FMN phosphatase YigB (HAD superfamily)